MPLVRSAIAVIVVLVLCAVPARCCEWSLGTHLGLTSIGSDTRDQGNSTVLAWPASTLAYQPALRIGVADSRRADELFVDSGQFLIDEAGSSLHMLVVDLGYQRVLAPRSATSLFGNVGVGRYQEGGAERMTTSGCYGAGLGVRHVLKSEQGVLRAEVRIDRLNSAGSIGRPRLTSLGLRLGFDLWL